MSSTIYNITMIGEAQSYFFVKQIQVLSERILFNFSNAYFPGFIMVNICRRSSSKLKYYPFLKYILNQEIDIINSYWFSFVCQVKPLYVTLIPSNNEQSPC
jgi:hypothetical protein